MIENARAENKLDLEKAEILIKLTKQECEDKVYDLEDSFKK